MAQTRLHTSCKHIRLSHHEHGWKVEMHRHNSPDVSSEISAASTHRRVRTFWVCCHNNAEISCRISRCQVYRCWKVFSCTEHKHTDILNNVVGRSVRVLLLWLTCAENEQLHISHLHSLVCSDEIRLIVIWFVAPFSRTLTSGPTFLPASADSSSNDGGVIQFILQLCNCPPNVVQSLYHWCILWLQLINQC